MELVNAVFYQGTAQKFGYDYQTVEFLLKRYGFQEVERQGCGKSHMPEICIDKEERASESLYVEGIK